MEFKNNIPIYLQVKQYLYQEIITGKLQPDKKIPSVRTLAIHLTVNANTVQKALQQLNTEGIIYTRRGEGNFVTEDTKMLKQTRKKLIKNELDKFIHNMNSLGINNQQIDIILADYLK